MDSVDTLESYVHELPLPNQVFFALVEATARLVEVSDKYWQSKGIHGARVRILVEIMKSGGSMLPSVLAQRIGVTKSNITLLLQPLEQDGLVLRGSDPQDGRKSIISITAAGRELLLHHLPDNRTLVAERMQALDEQELHQLMGLLTKLKRR
ncbi:MarR family transcriptional regulator [Paenibacillus sp. IB182496]|uniref:MarR family transcriptional regulator n=1 Tax=Paenibacillus sabuli TaxID=2772509 RepID=A0A927GUA0_9BACL|nr:MarR family transcriptional regulator [Paenibacillus sabuli]MBD2848131.1 MarR family transcriptional regulator [Paenibacillus sabuli]